MADGAPWEPQQVGPGFSFRGSKHKAKHISKHTVKHSLGGASTLQNTNYKETKLKPHCKTNFNPDEIHLQRTQCKEIGQSSVSQGSTVHLLDALSKTQ